MANNEDIINTEMLEALLAKSDALNHKLTNMENNTAIPCWTTMT